MERAIRRAAVAPLAIALLISAIVASSAAASGFAANDDPFYADLSGASSGSQSLAFGGQQPSCSGGDFTAYMAEATASIAPDLDAIECGGKPLEMNGCSFTFKPGVESSPGIFAGEYDIGPPGCGPITYNYYYTCNVSLYPTTGIAATYENVGSGDGATVRITTTGTSAVYSLSKPCGNGKQQVGAGYLGSWNVSAERAGEVGFSVTPKVLTGIGIEDGLAPLFKATHYPTEVAAESADGSSWEFEGSSVDCADTSYVDELVEPASELHLDVSFEDCTGFLGLPAKVETNGCQFALSVLPNSLEGEVGLACGAGKTLELKTYTSATTREEDKWICKVDIPTQTEIQSVDFSNGTFGSIPTDYDLSGMEGTNTKGSFLCPKATGPVAAEYVDDATMRGFR